MWHSQHKLRSLKRFHSDRFHAASTGQKACKPFRISSASVVSIPGDGNCLFHAFCHFIRDASPELLRKACVEYVVKNADQHFNDTTWKEWIRGFGFSTVNSYREYLNDPQNWGGQLEIAILSIIYGLHTHVYKKSGETYELIMTATCDEAEHIGGDVHLLYSGRVHYDVLVPSF